MTAPMLALDSSTSVGSAAVGDASGILAEVVLSVAGGHSSALLPAVDQALRAGRLTPRDLGAIVVGSGPGSFTGLRIAAATVKGMIQALGVPLYAYSGLLATAAGAWATAGTVCALFDARRRDVYAACYRFDRGGVEVVVEPSALSLDELAARLRDEPPAVWVGEGATMHRAELEREIGGRVAPAHLAMPRASALIWLASHAPELGRVEDSASWEPEYIRASGAERIAAAGRLGAGPAA